MRIVVIRPGFIGDALLTFPILVALREQYSKPSIIFVSNAAVLPLAKAWGIADEVIAYDKRIEHELLSPKWISGSTTLELFQQADRVICLGLDDTEQIRRKLLDVGVKQILITPLILNARRMLHLVEYVAEVVAVSVGKPEKILLPYTGPMRTTSSKPPIAVHPGSGQEHKCWPAKSFSELIDNLLRLQYPILLLAGPTDVDTLKLVRKHLRTSPLAAMLTLLNNVPLLEVSEQLKGCGGYVGNDSGMTHLAALVGVPTLALFGSTDPAFWRPLGPYVEIIREQPLKRLAVKRVLESIQHMYKLSPIEGYNHL